jgi:hypothetical protein
MENEPLNYEIEPGNPICREVKSLHFSLQELLDQLPVERYYTLENQVPVPAKNFSQWGLWMSQARQNGSRLVGLDEHRGIGISTVFLGVDQNRRSGSGPPLLFETFVYCFNPHYVEAVGGFLDYSQRYATWDEAQRGHWKAVYLTTRVMSRFWMGALRRLPRAFNGIFVRAFNRLMEQEIEKRERETQTNPAGGDDHSLGGPASGTPASNGASEAGGDQVPEGHHPGGEDHAD